MERTVFILAGHYASKSVVLNGHTFIEGKCEVICPGDVVPFVKRSLASYQAYPDRSYELEAAQKRDVENGIRNNFDPHTRSRLPEEVQSLHKPSSGGSAQESADDRGTNATTDAGDTGLRPEGNGLENPRIPEVTSEIDYRLKEIIESLDPNEEGHWTSEGLPSIDAVESAFGPNLTREDIMVSGEGWNRTQALEKQVFPVKKKAGRPKKTKEVAG